MDTRVAKVRRVGALLIVILAAAACGTKAQRNEMYKPLYRAARAIEGAIAVGVSYAEFGELTRALSTELLVASDVAQTDDEKRLVAAYAELLSIYKDSLAIWKHQIESSSKYEWLDGKIPIHPDLAPLAAKYKLVPPAPTPSSFGGDLQVLPSDAIQRVWEAASEKSRHAVALYYGRDSAAR